MSTLSVCTLLAGSRVEIDGWMYKVAMKLERYSEAREHVMKTYQFAQTPGEKALARLNEALLFMHTNRGQEARECYELAQREVQNDEQSQHLRTQFSAIFTMLEMRSL